MPNIRISKSAAFGLTFLVPLSGLFIAMRNFRMPYAKNIFWMWCCFMGLVFIFNAEASGSDGVRYAAKLGSYQEINTLRELSEIFYDKEADSADIYVPILTFLVSRVTTNAHILFFVFALVFGFFYSRNLWLVFNRIEGKVSLTILLIMLSFALVSPIWQINGVRMWTALHVFSYGFLHYLVEKDKSKLLFCGLSILIHFSFMLPVTILLIYLLLPQSRVNLDVLYVLFLITLLWSQLDLVQVRNFLKSVPFLDFIESRIDGYTSEGYAAKLEEKTSEMSSYVGVILEIKKWSIAALISVVWYVFRKDHRNVYMPTLYGGLLFSIVANIASTMPSGSRFLTLSAFIVFASVILLISNQKSLQRKWAVRVIATALIPSILLQIRLGAYYYGTSMVTQNFISAFFWEDVVPLMR